MIIAVGEKLHIMYRSLYEKSTRRHFMGEVVFAKDSLCRIEGYVFIYDDKKTEFLKKPELRTTIIDLAESGYIVNVISPNVNLIEVHYKYAQDIGLIATDGKSFSLNINEFGSKS
ncbi:hypothetical protein [Marinagarivorans algicola]|uniref:hypothetical protein n=1 Tax=Marinagarivorans algicola TaxID=1513270 RepID=UPI0006B42F53|nr:hypothetical protein [Marinagarivorans algicola]